MFFLRVQLAGRQGAKDPNAKLSWAELLENIASGAISGLAFGTGGTAVNRSNVNDRYGAPDVIAQTGKEKNIHAETSLHLADGQVRGLPMVEKNVETVQELPRVEQTSGQTATEPKGLPMVEKENTAGQSQTVENTRLSNADLDEYMNTGKTGHVKNAKQDLVKNEISPIMTKVNEVRQFMQDAISGKIRNQIRAYGKVGSRMANDVRAKRPDVNIDGYYLELESNHIAHLADHIEVDNDPRNKPLTKEQALEIPDYVDNYDDVLEVIKRKK